MIDRGIEPVILGHNGFIGVDHLSQERGNAKALQFQDPGRVREMLLHAHGLGIRSMMISTHPMAGTVSQMIGSDPVLAGAWRMYPLLPYIQKYVRGANEKGLVNVVLDALSGAGTLQKASMIVKGAMSALGDVAQALRLLVDVELLPFKGRALGAVFLHDVVTDLALALEIDDALEIFREHVEATYGVPAAFVTKNLPLLRQRLDRRGWTDTIVMASFNARGFGVNPSLDECAAAIARPGLRFVAMATLASGALAPDDAYRFLGAQRGIGSVVVGMSRREHADETVAAIRRHLASVAGRSDFGPAA